MDYSLNEAAALLGVAPSRLSKLSEHFDALLSDSARQTRAVSGSTMPRRYAEVDIALLERAKALLQSGHTYQQVLRELTGEQHPEPLDVQVEPSHHAPAPHDYTTCPLSSAQADDQDARTEDKQTAAMEQTLHAQQRQLDQLREYMERLQAENEALRQRRMPLRERYPRLFSSRTGIVLAVCGMAVLMGLTIALLDNPGAFNGANSAFVASTAWPSRSAVSSTNLALSATLSPQARTPAAAPAQAAATAPAQAVLPPATSPQPSPAPVTLPASAPTANVTEPAANTASAEELLQRVVVAEAALQTGQFEAVLDYGSGNQSSSLVRFDLGGEGGVPRLHITTTYTSTGSVQMIERIAIGDRTWQRQLDGTWAEVPEQQEGLGQLQTFLPHAARASNATLDRTGYALTLRWYDAESNADVTLVVDPATGIPRALRQVTRGSEVALTVTYRGWNTPVEILPPTGS
jgi:hypothetical protein